LSGRQAFVSPSTSAAVRVLLVEDDADLGRSIVSGLRAEGIDTAGASTCAAARESLLFAAHDVIVLDVMLLDGTGYDLCAFVRERGIETPILVLTARDAVADRVRGLGVGSANLGLRVRL
jgi:DNA-binding response OmpR family regulator